ncbi:MAG TPA: multidrug ABC transporter ATP-binding protein [Gammaproteobacteria bacterium]|nr:multidrug ABC transporter ATP-binding protein [Gammaproteobacteria bacterium]
MNALVSAKGLTKKYGQFRAIDDINFEIGAGRIVGLVGPNGAGKSTTLKAILGLIRYKGELQVMGRDPRSERAQMMHDVSYISDVASLPDWISVNQLLRLMEATHPSFNQPKTLDFLSRTDIKATHRVKQLSKGMKTQLHLAIVMGINARLLILDEPTLGLDIIYRKDFYSQLLNEYFDEQRTILVTTHQIEEIEHILTDLLFIDHGKFVLDMPIDEIGDHFTQVRVSNEKLEEARSLGPIFETQEINDHVMIFEDIERESLKSLGVSRTPHLADLFVARIKGEHHV